MDHAGNSIFENSGSQDDSSIGNVFHPKFSYVPDKWFWSETWAPIRTGNPLSDPRKNQLFETSNNQLQRKFPSSESSYDLGFPKMPLPTWSKHRTWEFINERTRRFDERFHVRGHRWEPVNVAGLIVFASVWVLKSFLHEDLENHSFPLLSSGIAVYLNESERFGAHRNNSLIRVSTRRVDGAQEFPGSASTRPSKIMDRWEERTKSSK